ncbi:hypothetical protein [Bacillus sp. NPDC094106]|uniref:hypothetical protein n=1 Tax=Bacillus sp. NPDC094106 TaxID=3363949 RepID=UPI0037FA1D05
MHRVITIEFVKEEFKKAGIELVSTTYEGRMKPLVYKCKKHGELTKTWANFNRSPGCSKCNEKHVDMEEVKTKVEESGFELLTKTSINSRQYIKFKCKLHGIKEVKWMNFRRVEIGCPECRKQHRKEKSKKHTKVNLNEKEKELVGKKYSCLQVLGFHSVYKDGKTLFKCQCDCGKTTFANKSQLFRKLKQSCGCIKKRPRKFLKLNGESKSINEWSAYFGICQSTLRMYLKKGYTYEDLYYKKLNKRSSFKKIQKKEMNYILNKFKSIYPDVEEVKYRRHDLEVCGKRILIKYANANDKGRASFTYVQRQRRNKEIYENETILKNGKIKDINEHSCDYVLFLVSKGDEYNTWIIPIEDIREDAQGVSLATGRRSKFSLYEEAWDLISLDESEQVELAKTA